MTPEKTIAVRVIGQDRNKDVSLDYLHSMCNEKRGSNCSDGKPCDLTENGCHGRPAIYPDITIILDSKRLIPTDKH